MLARFVITISTVFLLCTAHLSAYAAQQLTLDECIQLGLKSNPAIKSAKLKVDWSEEGIKEARSDFLPSLSASSSYAKIDNIYASGPTDSDFINQSQFVHSLRLSQILYAGSRIYNTYSRAMVQKDMEEAEQEFAKTKLILNIEATFFQLMKAKEDVAAATDTVERLKSSLQAASAFYKQEMAPYVEVLQAKVDLANAEDQLSQLKNNVDRKRAELFQLMNIPFSETIRFDGGLGYYTTGFKTTPEECWANAVRNRSDLKSLQKQIDMVEKDIQIAKGKYLPVVQMNVSVNDSLLNYAERGYSGYTSIDRDQHNTYWNAGVSVTWNLFDGGRAWYEKNKNVLDKLRLLEDIKGLENDINAQIRTELLTLSEAESRIASTSSAVEAAREYYATEEKRFQAGIATIPSLLDAQARMTRADANHNQARLDYHLARASLKFITGQKADTNLQ
ncbi:TolC family protein [Desulfopila aestuarii]|uniref:Outer membrane protein TolC n=1 Tax=Desulfopila aestuarii DSM 18488 TaxID=1121416 RepID=A0A1M7YI18_9BACT|nr:TolC family protein [Desulfopila aestuarii]SHO52261.1 Outer membrane protein TolC [Desulfopila aestuarii DSM 18488]